MGAVELMLVFTSPDCSPCKTIKPILDDYARSIMNTRIQYLNINESFDECAQFNIRSVPSVICLDRQGKILNRLDGVQPKTLQKLLGI